MPGFEYPTSAHRLWGLVAESLQGWQQRMEEVAAAAGISPVAAWALVQLDPDEPISQKELSNRLHCNPSTVVDPTDRLEEAGLVLRRANPEDRRVNVLVVTARGRRARRRLLEELFEPPAAFTRLSERERQRFLEVMLDVVEGMRSLAAAR